MVAQDDFSVVIEKIRMFVMVDIIFYCCLGWGGTLLHWEISKVGLVIMKGIK